MFITWWEYFMTCVVFFVTFPQHAGSDRHSQARESARGQKINHVSHNVRPCLGVVTKKKLFSIHEQA